jgi:flagellar hook-associated protein 1 FlgK
MIYILNSDKAGVGMDGPPPSVGQEIFSRKSTARYGEPVEITYLDENGVSRTEKAYVYAAEDTTNNYTLYTISELMINPNVMFDKSAIPLSRKNMTGDYEIQTCMDMIARWREPIATLNPNTLTYNSVTEYYDALMRDIGIKGEKFRNMRTNQEILTKSIDNKRQIVAGVSSDEELTNLIRFQQAYNASARYVNVLDEMLEHLIMRLGA